MITATAAAIADALGPASTASRPLTVPTPHAALAGTHRRHGHDVERGPVCVLDAVAAHFLPRAGAVKVGRRADRVTRAGVSRPYLDGPEHGRTMMGGGAARVQC
jgi:hypothetical protein